MGTVLGYIIALLVVGGLLFLAASYTFGRGEEMAPVLPDGTPVELPDDRLAGGDDLRALRLSVAVRGYRMDEVDWLLDRMAEQVDTRDREIARLRSVLHVEPVDAEPELLTHPFPPVVDTSTDYRAEHARADDADPDPELAAGRTHSTGHADANGHADAIGEADAGDRTDPGGAGADEDSWRPRAVPEGTGDTGARPDRPARQVRTSDSSDAE